MFLFKSLRLNCCSTISVCWQKCQLSLYSGTTDIDVTQQSHDSVETTNTGLTLLSNNITAGGGFVFSFFFLKHTSTPTWASERIVSERCFSWKQVGNTSWWGGGEKRKGGKEEEEEERGIEIKQVRKALVMSAIGSVIIPMRELPCDIWGDCGSHILHYGLNPVAADSRGHGRQRARSLFTLEADRQGILLKWLLVNADFGHSSQNKWKKMKIQACESGAALTVTRLFLL